MNPIESAIFDVAKSPPVSTIKSEKRKPDLGISTSLSSMHHVVSEALSLSTFMDTEKTKRSTSLLGLLQIAEEALSTDTPNASLNTISNPASSLTTEEKQGLGKLQLARAKICRICLSDDNTENIISPCSCIGSARFVHRKCIDKWRKLSPNPQSRIQCEVCKSYYRFKNGMLIAPLLSIESAKFMALVGLVTYYATVVYSLAHFTLAAVAWIRMPPAAHLYSLQSIPVYQYFPGLYVLGAYSSWQNNNLFTVALSVSIVSLFGRINDLLGLLADIYWAILVAFGMFHLLKAIKWKVNLIGPKLYNLLIEMNTDDDLLSLQ